MTTPMPRPRLRFVHTQGNPAAWWRQLLWFYLWAPVAAVGGTLGVLIVGLGILRTRGGEEMTGAPFVVLGAFAFLTALGWVVMVLLRERWVKVARGPGFPWLMVLGILGAAALMSATTLVWPTLLGDESAGPVAGGSLLAVFLLMTATMGWSVANLLLMLERPALGGSGLMLLVLVGVFLLQFHVWGLLGILAYFAPLTIPLTLVLIVAAASGLAAAGATDRVVAGVRSGSRAPGWQGRRRPPAPPTRVPYA